MEIINTHIKGNLKNMAEKVGISPAHLCNILALRTRPSPGVAKALYRVTGIAIDVWLFPFDNLNPQVEKFKKTIKQRKNKKRKEGRKTKPEGTL